MDDIIITDIDDVEIEAAYTHQIESGLDTVDIVVDNAALINIEPVEYYLTSGGIYTGRMQGNYPQWLIDYIDNQLETSVAIDNNTIIDSLRSRLAAAEDGISQQLLYINNNSYSLAALDTIVKVSMEDRLAGVENLIVTKVDENGAIALSAELIDTKFGNDVEAYKASVSTAISNASTAWVSSYETLVADFNDTKITLEDTKEVVVKEINIWNGIGEPILADLYEINGIWYQYLGGQLGPNFDGWVHTNVAHNYEQGLYNKEANNRLGKLYSEDYGSGSGPSGTFYTGDIWVITNRWYDTDGETLTAIRPTNGRLAVKRYDEDSSSWVLLTKTEVQNSNISWAGYASSLLTTPDGSITGWEYADGSDTESQFSIYAQNFRISDGINRYTPFSINSVDHTIQFNGLVSFNNTTDTEDVLLTGDAANDVNTNTTTINGGKITAGSVTANEISSSYIYTGTLNANQITAGTIGADYIASDAILGKDISLLTNLGFRRPRIARALEMNTFIEPNPYINPAITTVTNPAGVPTGTYGVVRATIGLYHPRANYIPAEEYYGLTEYTTVTFNADETIYAPRERAPSFGMKCIASVAIGSSTIGTAYVRVKYDEHNLIVVSGTGTVYAGGDNRIFAPLSGTFDDGKVWYFTFSSWNGTSAYFAIIAHSTNLYFYIPQNLSIATEYGSTPSVSSRFVIEFGYQSSSYSGHYLKESKIPSVIAYNT